MPGLVDSDGRGAGSLKLKNAVLHARLEKARRKGDTAQIEKALHTTWQSDLRDGYYDATASRFTDWFLAYHQAYIDALGAHCAAHRYTQLIEIGCGDGQILNHHATHLDHITRFIGLDINPAIIKANTSRFASTPTLQFEAGNALDILDAKLADNTLLTTYGGVFEYFTRADIEIFASKLRSFDNTAISVVEPLDHNHDLSTDKTSQIYGIENSFSHNYPDILHTAGFTLEFCEELPIGKHRFIAIIAR
jgi:SAM-dependent methyltransferase